MENQAIVTRFDANVSQRNTIEQTWQMINDYVMPFRSEFFDDQKSEHSVEWRKNRKVFDSTAIMANQTLAASLHGSLTSPSTIWFTVKFKEDELNSNIEARRWLEKAGKAVYQALQDSNFNIEINETYVDLAGYGSSVTIEEYEVVNNKVELAFHSVPIEECFFEEDDKGQVEIVYRRLRWTAKQIVSKFGEDGVPKHILDAAKDHSSVDTKFDVVFCIFKRNKNKYEGKPLADNQRPIGKKYILHASSELLGKEGGYYEMPAFVSRWRKATGSKWGYSQAMLALPDILTLNQLVEMTLRAAEKVIDPAIMVTERGLLSDIDLGPGGLTVVRELNAMQAFESKAKFDVGELQKQNLIESIRRVFHIDQLELRDASNMTATEVQVRYELMQRLLGPTLGRLQTDLLNPIVDRTFNILLREGQFEEPPQILREVSSSLEIDYVGALSRAQKSDVATSVERWVASVSAMAEFAPDILDNPDFDGIAEGLADMFAVPASMRTSQDEKAKKRKDRAEQQQAMQQAEMQKQQGEAMIAQGEGQKSLNEGEQGV